MTDEIEKKRSAEATRMAEVIGSTGLKISGGYVSEEWLPELRGQRGARTYREMSDNESTLGAVIFIVTTLLRQAEWTVQAADESPEAEDGKAFVEECLDDMAETFQAVVAEIATMFLYGYAPMEITLKRRSGPNKADPLRHSRFSDGRIGVASLALRAQSSIARWDVDERTGHIKGLWQQPPTGPEVYIPAEKLLLFRTTEERNNPEGRSILRSAYRDWYFKKRIEEIEAIGIERDLAGLPIARLPRRYFQADATPAERALLDRWSDLVTSVRRDQREGLVIPSEFDAQGNQLFSFDLLSSGGARTFDTTKIIDRRSRAMATAVLADFLFLGQQAVGSFALSSDKTALFATALGAFAASIAAVLNRRLIPLLWEVNGWDEAVLPKIVCGDLENPNLAELAQLLATLAGAGAPLFPDRDLENHIRRMAGLPLVPEEGDGIDGDPAGGTTPAEIAAMHDRGLAPDGTPEAMLMAEQPAAGGEEDE